MAIYTGDSSENRLLSNAHLGQNMDMINSLNHQTGECGYNLWYMINWQFGYVSLFYIEI